MNAAAPGAPSGAPHATLADVAWLTLGATSCAALAHVVQVEVRYRLLGVFTWTHREFAWLSLMGYLAWFLAAAIPIVVGVALLRRRPTLALTTTWFATLAGLAPLLLYRRVHPIALVVLAAGLALQGGRWVASRPTRGRRWIRRLSLGAIAGVSALGVSASIGHRLGEPGRLAALPPAATGTPNIVLLILDTVRAASMSLYGYERPTTPVLDAMAREATVFDLAMAVESWTAPSHASMMTGLWPSQAGADYLHPIHDSLPTVAERLAALGMASGGFMANTGYAGYQLGIARGFTHYEDFPFTLRQALWSTTFAQTASGQQLVDGLLDREAWRIRAAFTHPSLRSIAIPRTVEQPAADIADHFFSWRDAVGDRPYFAMLNFMDAHVPYEPPDGFRTRFGDGRVERDRYDGGIAYEDSIIGSVIQRLSDRGELDRTILIVTSDHGEHWGEHGLESHGNSLYVPVLHVPLLIRAPGRIPQGLRIPHLVSLRDLAATILHLAGAPPGQLPGAPLASAWGESELAPLSPVIAEAAVVVNPGPRNLTRFGPIRAAFDSAWHSIHYSDGRSELFAWQVDTGEVDDRSATGEGKEVVRRHQGVIATALGSSWPVPRRRLH